MKGKIIKGIGGFYYIKTEEDTKENDDFDEAFFDALDAENGAAKLARLLIEECTDLNLFVGKALNPAHQNSNLPFDLSVRMNLVEQLKDCAERMGKHVTVKYY